MSEESSFLPRHLEVLNSSSQPQEKPHSLFTSPPKIRFGLHMHVIATLLSKKCNWSPLTCCRASSAGPSTCPFASRASEKLLCFNLAKFNGHAVYFNAFEWLPKKTHISMIRNGNTPCLFYCPIHKAVSRWSVCLKDLDKKKKV